MAKDVPSFNDLVSANCSVAETDFASTDLVTFASRGTRNMWYDQKGIHFPNRIFQTQRHMRELRLVTSFQQRIHLQNCIEIGLPDATEF